MRTLVCVLTYAATLALGVARADPLSSVKLVATDVGTFHVRAAVGTLHEVEFLLDTGSAYVVLAERTRRELERAGMLKPLRPLRALMANNAVVNAQVYQVARLQLAEGCVVHDFEAVALPGAPKNILGLSALRAMAPFTVHLSPARLDLTCPMVLASGVTTVPR